MKDFDWNQLWLAASLALVGGCVHILGKVVNGLYKTKWGILLDLLTAAFAGSLAFVTCQYFHIDSWLVGALTGLSGHGGARAIAFGERLLANRLGIVEEKANPDPK